MFTWLLRALTGNPVVQTTLLFGLVLLIPIVREVRSWRQS